MLIQFDYLQLRSKALKRDMIPVFVRSVVEPCWLDKTCLVSGIQQCAVSFAISNKDFCNI